MQFFLTTPLILLVAPVGSNDPFPQLSAAPPDSQIVLTIDDLPAQWVQDLAGFKE